MKIDEWWKLEPKDDDIADEMWGTEDEEQDEEEEEE